MAGFFGFFDYTKPGKGLSKEDVDKKGVALYLDIVGRRFWKLIQLNFLFLAASIPAIIIGWMISVFAVTWLASLSQVEFSQEWINGLTLLAVFVTVIFLQLCGSGPASAGMNYVLRKYANDTHSWVWSDFWDNFKSNFKQSVAVYIINVFLTSIMAVSFVFYRKFMQGFSSTVLSTIIVVIFAMFYMMQIYTYQIMVSFELKLKDIYRNALILVLAKLPWNVLTLVVTLLLFRGIFALAMSVPIVGVAVVLAIFYALLNFTQIFMSNNVIKKLLLEPALSREQESALEKAEKLIEEENTEE